MGYCSPACQSQSWRGCGPTLARNESVPDPHWTWCVRPGRGKGGGGGGSTGRARELADFALALLESVQILLLRLNGDVDDNDFDADSALDRVESDLADTFERPNVLYAPLV